jgi:predicted SAM-dependent methyltransferase
MLSRSLKSAYYAAASVPMAVSGKLYKLAAAPRTGTVRVHLGPGRLYHLPGWINVDANAFGKKRPEVWADLRNELPFHDGTVDAFYSHHVIEHLPDSDLPRHCADMFRCLKPGGVIRVGGPNADEAARQLLAGNKEWFSDYPDKRSSVGGRFANFILCRGEHTAILTLSYLQELLDAAGFVGITQRLSHVTGHESLFSDAMVNECERLPETPHTLIVEARKG